MPNNYEFQIDPLSPLLAKKQAKYQTVEDKNSQTKPLKIFAYKAEDKNEDKTTKRVVKKIVNVENNTGNKQTAFNLNNLPDEWIIAHIFNFLDHDSATNLALVNKRFFKLYVKSIKLYHKQWLKDLNSSNQKSSIIEKRISLLTAKLTKLKSNSNTLKFFGTCAPNVVGSSTGTLACLNKIHCAYVSFPMLKFLIGAGSGVIASGVTLAVIAYFTNQQMGMLNQEIEELESDNSKHSNDPTYTPRLKTMME